MPVDCFRPFALIHANSVSGCEMSYRSRKIVILADTGVGLLVARAALPVLLTWLANLALNRK
jgi:hypothetical protein